MKNILASLPSFSSPAERAAALMSTCFKQGMGSMERVEPRLASALSDILSHPGSLVRAVTAYFIGIEFGVVEEAAMAVACGIEYLHTASLVFDDLPAMDDAQTRRDAPCVHVTHGESVAMLASLAMINRGYTLIWQGIRRASPIRQAQAGDLVGNLLGTNGVIGGQAYDLKDWKGQQSAAVVNEVAARKTGDLLRLTLVLPAMIGHGTDREIQLLDRIGMLRGLAYQAADDLKDVAFPKAGDGKTHGRDESLGRPNLILAEGFEAALERFNRLQRTGDRVQAALTGPPERWWMLSKLRVTMPMMPTTARQTVAA
jgi:geranylgeranyl pyrophosphate synthase